jgi:hypothetical protein
MVDHSGPSMFAQRATDSGANCRARRSAHCKAANHKGRGVGTRVVKVTEPKPRDRSEEA